MDQSGIERFVHVCGKHSPQGPYHIMDPRFFERIPDYADSILSYVKNGQIVFYGYLEMQTPIKFQEELIKVLEELYTPIPWKEVEHIPRPEGIPPERILFRKR